ncbi:MAG: ribonuclease M5 [Atopostipes suicloacalis]|nr:ribonuclease M5 [Atopostipes suicloacalis]
MEKPKIKEVIVVEGKKDTEKIQLAVEAPTIETQGMALEEETLDLIEHAQKEQGVIVFTDPDYPGETIRKKITARIPEVKHAFIRRDEGTPKHKGTLGIEHASIESIQKALEGLYEISADQEKMISKKFLRKHGLMAGKNSKELRIQLGEALRIGYTNSKQLQKRLSLFNISKEEVLITLNKLKEEGYDD